MEHMERELTAREKNIARPFGRKWAEKANIASYRVREADRVREGEAVRQQVRVHTPVKVHPETGLGPSIVHTRIRRPPEGTPWVGKGQRPGEIMKNMGVGDTYDRLRVEEGAGNGGVKVKVVSPDHPTLTEPPSTLANGLTANTAVINGGFFGTKKETSKTENEKGRPVGPTKDREDSLRIPQAYRGDYRALKVGGKVGISSGPILEPSQGENTFEDARFQHKYSGKREYPQYNEAGNVNHASDKNPRAGISIFPPKKSINPLKEKVTGDVIMHTLTIGDAPRDGTHGATMKEWQDITTQGSYQYKLNKDIGKKKEDIKESKKRPSTLNLDGGGSVYMGITRGKGQINQIAKGEPSNKDPRAVPDIIFAGGGQENEGKKISIKDSEKPDCNIM